MIDLRLEALTHRFGPVTALEGVTLDIGGGATTALLGPSGCGKTTALKLLAGLLSPTAGRIRFDRRDVTHVPAERRGAVMVFQDHRLFPFLDVADNVAFGLRMRGVRRWARRRQAAAVLERVGLAGLDRRRPTELSGGQRRRVALARALVLRPDVLLLDEPLANLDAHLRDGMRQLIVDLQRERRLTTVVVTHDQEEAVVLADEIALLFDGRVHQHGAPRTFFERPTSERAARFFGAVNLIPGRRVGEHVQTPLGSLRAPHGVPDVSEVWVTIRPERVLVRASGRHPSRAPTTPTDGGRTIPARVLGSSFRGTRTRARLEVGGVSLTVDATGDALVDVGPGSVVHLELPPEALWTMPRDHRRQPVAESGSPGDDRVTTSDASHHTGDAQ